MSVLIDLKNRGVVMYSSWSATASKPIRSGGQCVAANNRADLCHPLNSQYLPVGPQLPGDDPTLAQGLGEFTPFLDYNVEIRRMRCSTNAIESLNARYRRAIPARCHFPTEQATIQCVYLVTRSPDPTGAAHTRWTMR